MLSNMKSALAILLGVTVLATVVGCDNGGGDDDDSSGPKAVAGSASTTAGTGTTAGTSSVVPMGGTDSGTGGSGTVTPAAGVPLTPTDGWVDGMSNTLGVQGAMFSYADDTSKMGLVEDFLMDHACIKGTAAKVDMTSMPCATKMFTPPATDCYGQFWGAAIGLNMNQAIDMTTMMGSEPAAFDASAITGFAFEIAGTMIPAPTAIRFKVENAGGEYCNPATKPIKAGENKLLFSELITACWKPVAGAATGTTAQKDLKKIAWQVVTNDKSTVPFDFCVKNVRAITE